MPKDIRGVEIEVGDFIVYPGRGGSSLWMNAGIVTEIEESVQASGGRTVSVTTLRLMREQHNWKGEFQGYRKSYTRKLERVAVVEKGHHYG
jgi:hypothetical protein